jgi:hypothetical protein
MNRASLYRRVVRRETHSPRTTVTLIALLVLVIVAVWLGTEIVLNLLGLAPLLIAPTDLAAAVAAAATLSLASVLSAGIAAVIVGLLLLFLGVLPGRKGKHSRIGERAAVIVDDRVIAASLATQAAKTAGTTREQVKVAVGSGSVDVIVTPASGVPVDQVEVQDTVEREIADYDLNPRMRARVRVSERGAVGV